jgi:hypothetical protein
MNWALRRQIIYLLIFVGIIGIVVFLLFLPYLNKAPTCTDNRKNGDEIGVDCGGSCLLACRSQVEDVSIIWSRAFEVVPGRYNAVAYLENHNENTAVLRVKYRFRFADKDNVYISSREGETFIPPSRKFAVFEPAVDTGSTVPVYTTFEFMENPTWIQVPKEKVDQLKVFSSNIKLENEDTSPKLSATVKNYSLFRIPEVSLVAILYDEMGNAVNVSKTYLDVLTAEETANINFTWPKPFGKKIVAKEIIPMFDVFSVKLK